MIVRALHLALAGSLVAASGAVAQVTGRVIDARSGEGVELAIVRLTAHAGQRTTFSGAAGTYAFDDVEPAEYLLSVVHAGYDPTRVRIIMRPGGALTIDLPIDPRPVRMRNLEVRGQRLSSVINGGERDDSAKLFLNLQRIGRMGPHAAGALGDLALAKIARDPLRSEHGGRQPHVLYIWGSNAERGRVKLDGATLNAPLHLGGILPSFDPELLASAELRTGGSSPRHDGGTSYIMDFETRSAAPDSVHVRADLDWISGGATAEVPLGHESSVLIGARRINHELAESVLDRRFGYGYSDLLARADLRAGASGRVAATAFRTHESVQLPRDLDEDRAVWQNFATAVSWRAPSNAVARLVNASYSRGIVDLPLLSAPGGHLRVTVDRYAASAERRWDIGRSGVLAGVELEHVRFTRRTTADADPASPDLAGPVACTPSLPCARLSSTFIAPFGEITWQLSPRLSARAGMRANYQVDRSHVSPLPRLSLTAVDARAATAVTISAGRFSQVHTVEGRPEAAGESADGEIAAPRTVTRPPRIVLAHATQLDVQLARRSTRTILAASIQLHVHEGSGSDIAPLTAPGADVSWAYLRPSWRLTVGYSLLGRRRSLDASALTYQHLAAAAFAATRGRVSLNLTGAYGRGMPVTSVVLERPVNPDHVGGPTRGVDDRTYLRMDALLSAEWTLDPFGRPMRFAPYARLVNGLSRREALFYFHDGAANTEPRPLATMAALPALGLRLQF